MAILAISACWASSNPSPTRPCTEVEVVNRSYFDHVVHVEGRRVGFAVGLSTTDMRMCYDRTTAGLVLTVHQMGGARYDVRSEASWMPGEPVRLTIGSLPNFTRLEPVRRQ